MDKKKVEDLLTSLEFKLTKLQKEAKSSGNKEEIKIPGNFGIGMIGNMEELNGKKTEMIDRINDSQSKILNALSEINQGRSRQPALYKQSQTYNVMLPLSQ